MLGLIQWIKNFAAKIQRDNISAYAAQSAYFVILSFFPFVMFLLTLLNFLPIDANTLINELVGIFPESSAGIVTPIVNEILSKSSGTLMSITIFVLLWTAGKGLMALTNGLNAVHEIKQTRNYFVLRIISTIYTLLFALMIILVLIVLVFGNQLQPTGLSRNCRFSAILRPLLISIRTFASLMILTTVFLLFYKMLPAVKVRLWHQLPGAVFSWPAAGCYFPMDFQFILIFPKIFLTCTEALPVLFC